MSFRNLMLAAWLFVPLAAVLGADGPSKSPVRLKILSYNIHHAEGVDGKLDVERIAAVIRGCEADVAAVQEVDRAVERSQKIDEPRELARLTKLEHFVFGKTIDHQGGDYGNLVLSRFPIVSSRVHRFPNSAGAEQRGAVEAEIAPPGGAAFRLFATHLDFGRRDASEADRQAAIELVNSRVEATAQPAVFAGDFNSGPDSKTITTIKELWLQSNSNDAFTTPVDRPTRQIDFIFLRPRNRWKVIDVKVLDEAVASDHRPILATVELLPPAAAQ
jgi:endonuclease/exonuclease/phosphatase family metal-dependent hydrolase